VSDPRLQLHKATGSEPETQVLFQDGTGLCSWNSKTFVQVCRESGSARTDLNTSGPASRGHPHRVAGTHGSTVPTTARIGHDFGHHRAHGRHVFDGLNDLTDVVHLTTALGTAAQGSLDGLVDQNRLGASSSLMPRRSTRFFGARDRSPSRLRNGAACRSASRLITLNLSSRSEFSLRSFSFSSSSSSSATRRRSCSASSAGDGDVGFRLALSLCEERKYARSSPRRFDDPPARIVDHAADGKGCVTRKMRCGSPASSVVDCLREAE
jgi:hypothetical protein